MHSGNELRLIYRKTEKNARGQPKGANLHSIWHKSHNNNAQILEWTYKIIKRLKRYQFHLYLLIYNCDFPKIYCLPKIHKPDIILSSINSRTYNISKLLADILEDAREDGSSCNIKDTFSIVNNIRGSNYQKIKCLSYWMHFPYSQTSLWTYTVIEIIKEKW